MNVLVQFYNVSFSIKMSVCCSQNNNNYLKIGNIGYELAKNWLLSLKYVVICYVKFLIDQENSEI